MKKKQKLKKAIPAADKHGRPTLLEFIGSYQVEASKQFGTKLEIDPELHVFSLPDWAKKTTAQVGKTIITLILKLRPHKNSTCQDYLRQAESFAQGVAEIRALTGWLLEQGLEQGCPAVALWGNSLGGWSAGLAALRDARLAAVVLTVPGGGAHGLQFFERGERRLEACSRGIESAKGGLRSTGHDAVEFDVGPTNHSKRQCPVD